MPEPYDSLIALADELQRLAGTPPRNDLARGLAHAGYLARQRAQAAAGAASEPVPVSPDAGERSADPGATDDGDWLAQEFRRTEREYRELPQAARPVVVPPQPVGEEGEAEAGRIDPGALAAAGRALEALPPPDSRFERDRWRIVSRIALAAAEPRIRATERSRLFVAIRRGIPLDKPWRGEALDMIFDAIQPGEQL